MFPGLCDWSVTFGIKTITRLIECYEEGCEGIVQAKTKQLGLYQALRSQATYVLPGVIAARGFETRHR